MADYEGSPLAEALDRFIEDLQARHETYEVRIRVLHGLSEACEEALQAASRLKAWIDREVLVEPPPTEHELARMTVEGALLQLALSDQYRIVNTEAVVDILQRAGHLPKDHPNPPRVLSGILGASRQFSKIAPGRFRLLDEHEVLADNLEQATDAADAKADAEAKEQHDEDTLRRAVHGD